MSEEGEGAAGAMSDAAYVDASATLDNLTDTSPAAIYMAAYPRKNKNKKKKKKSLVIKRKSLEKKMLGESGGGFYSLESAKDFARKIKRVGTKLKIKKTGDYWIIQELEK